MKLTKIALTPLDDPNGARIAVDFSGGAFAREGEYLEFAAEIDISGAPTLIEMQLRAMAKLGGWVRESVEALEAARAQEQAVRSED